MVTGPETAPAGGGHREKGGRLGLGLGLASLVAQMVRHLPAMQVDLGSIPGSGRCLGGGNGNPLSTLAWKIPWIEERSRLQSTGSLSWT